MSTSQGTIEFLLDQLSQDRTIRARKMFGEYALYCDEKVVALVCDDQLFVKITPAGREWVGDGYVEAPAYPGAKPSMLIAGDRFDDREWLGTLIRRTADALPVPKPKPKPKVKTKTKTKTRPKERSAKVPFPAKRRRPRE